MHLKGGPTVSERTPRACRPENTAISRAAPSKPAQAVVRFLLPTLRVERLLDFACGRGRDVKFFRAEGLQAEGYDSHPAFDHAAPPRGRFDLVTAIYLLNVLDSTCARVEALREA